jgi:hypothetical protein
MGEVNDFQCNRPFIASPSVQQRFYSMYNSSGKMPPELYSFWCIIDGESEPFSVVVDVDGNLDDLKRAIKSEKNALKVVDTSSIVSWKVRIFWRPT